MRSCPTIFLILAMLANGMACACPPQPAAQTGDHSHHQLQEPSVIAAPCHGIDACGTTAGSECSTEMAPMAGDQVVNFQHARLQIDDDNLDISGIAIALHPPPPMALASTAREPSVGHFSSPVQRHDRMLD